VAQLTETIRVPEECGVTLPAGVWPGGPRHRRWLGWPIGLASGVLALTLGVVLVDRMVDRRLATELPDVPPISRTSSGCGDGTSEMNTAPQRGTFCSIEHKIKN
jgi:hypothetical protein